MMSGGSGLMLAQWMVKGQPELDMFGYDIRYDALFVTPPLSLLLPYPPSTFKSLPAVRRFNNKLLENQEWIRERTHEHYAKHYSIHFHFDEPLAGRGAIKDVLYEVIYCR